jgi:hypothetical protein
MGVADTVEPAYQLEKADESSQYFLKYDFFANRKIYR